MALPTSITSLLSGRSVEWARIEFKETWDAQASLKTICAFANDLDNWGGGYLVIGVRDGGEAGRELVGVPPEHVDAYLKDLLNKCRLIHPEYLPIVEVAEYEEKLFIVVWAPGGSVRPYSSPKSMAKDEKQRVHYIRKMASTVAPTAEEERELYSLADNVPFDDRTNHHASLNDLNITLIKSYLHEVGSTLADQADTMDFEELCRDMNIMSQLPEYKKPKNVGLLFFCMEPERFFPYAQIDVVSFPDDLGGDTIIERTFTGPIHQQLRDALLYIKNTVIEERVVKLPDVAEARRFFNYPYAAVEEALSNAVYHKGYDEREPIEVRVLPDRIEILSHPGAVRSVSQEGLREYRVASRRYRNRRIGEFLKELHLTEGRNTGFRKILNALEANGSPKPLFETDDERTYFMTTLYIHPDAHPDVRRDAGWGAGDACGYDKGLDNKNAGGAGAAGREAAVLAYFAARPEATLDVAACDLGVGRSTVARAVKALKAAGRMERMGSASHGSWRVIG